VGQRGDDFVCADSGDDLFNFVHDPATLTIVRSTGPRGTGKRTVGVDGLTDTDVERHVGVPGRATVAGRRAVDPGGTGCPGGVAR
jgi:hypothetical protein